MTVIHDSELNRGANLQVALTERSRHLAWQLEQLPQAPGVYHFYDQAGRLLYVGKSNSLRRRVRSYFNTKPNWTKVLRLVDQIADIRVTETRTHLEARLLECYEIKKRQPEMNSQFKRDNRYVYLSPIKSGCGYRITHDRLHGSIGPFRSRFALSDFLEAISHLYPLKLVQGRFQLTHQVLAPRLSVVDEAEAREMLHRIIEQPEIGQPFLESVDEQMVTASEAMQFERAVYYRDLSRGLQAIRKLSSSYRGFLEQSWLYAVPHGTTRLLYYVRGGWVYGSVLVNDRVPSSSWMVQPEVLALWQADQTLCESELFFGQSHVPDRLAVDDQLDLWQAAFSSEQYLMVNSQTAHRTVPQTMWDPAEQQLLVPLAHAPRDLRLSPKALRDFQDIVFSELMLQPQKGATLVPVAGSQA